jgi:RNA polymerase sigma-70 factor, ECF subfamily
VTVALLQENGVMRSQLLSAEQEVQGFDRPTSSERFQGLCARYRPNVFRFALWLARDGAIAEDVVQETFLRAWRAIDSLDEPEAALSWLITIARREHARLYERKRYIAVALDDLIALDDPALAAAPTEEHCDVYAALISLDKDYREPLVLQARMGYSTIEIASHMGLTVSAVLTRLHRARGKLRLALNITEGGRRNVGREPYKRRVRVGRHEPRSTVDVGAARPCSL